MALSFRPGVTANMALVPHSAAIQFPNDDVQLKASQIVAIKSGSRHVITIYVEVPRQRVGDFAGQDSKMIQYVAYIIHPYTFEVYQASGQEWGEYVGDIMHLFPQAAKQLELAVRVRNENIENGSIHVYPKPNCPGPRFQEYVLLNPSARFVRAELGKPSDEPLVIMFLNIATGKVVPEFYRAKATTDFYNPAHVKDINKWRCQVMSRKKCDLVRFDKALDEMWTVKEQGVLTKVVRHIVEYHKRLGVNEDETFDRIDWVAIRSELEKECQDIQVAGSPLAICCVADYAGEGFDQRRTLLADRPTFCRTSELITQRAIDTIATIMDSEVDEEVLQGDEKFFILKPAPKTVACSSKGKKPAAPFVSDKVVSGRITKTQANGKKTGAKRGAKAKGVTGAAKPYNGKKAKAAAAAKASQTEEANSAVDSSPQKDDSVATPGTADNGETTAASLDVVMSDSPEVESAVDDTMDVDEEYIEATMEDATPSADSSTPGPRPKLPTRRSARQKK